MTVKRQPTLLSPNFSDPFRSTAWRQEAGKVFEFYRTLLFENNGLTFAYVFYVNSFTLHIFFIRIFFLENEPQNPKNHLKELRNHIGKLLLCPPQK